MSTYRLYDYSSCVNLIMSIHVALNVFFEQDQLGRNLFTLQDIGKFFQDEKPKTLQESINRLVKKGILERVAKGIYLFSYRRHRGTRTLEKIAITLRRGEYNYISLESALSEYGIISQILIDRITVMTTGRKGEYTTPYGTIEFTHTKRKRQDIIAGCIRTDRPLNMATATTAWRDLKRVGRNTHLVDISELNNE